MAHLPWEEFAAGRTAPAGPVRGLLYNFGVGQAYLSTVRPDGGPRLHPFCPMLIEGHLVAHIIPSPKRDDLSRDPRYALHSFPMPDNEDAFYLTGEAFAVGDSGLADRAAAQFLAERHMPDTPPEFSEGIFFEFLISRCLLTKTSGHGDWNPRHHVWAARA
jgi:hypothetical protein